MGKITKIFNIVLNNNLIFMVLFVINPLLLFMSLNPTAYLLEQYLSAMVQLFCVALVSSMAIECLFLFCPDQHLISYLNKRVFYLLIAFAITFDSLRIATEFIIPSTKIYSVIIIILLLFALVIEKKRTSIIINSLTLLFSSTCLLLYGSAILEGYGEENQLTAAFNRPQEVNIVNFLSRPNVYFFNMLAYHGKEAMIEQFNFDNAEFYDYLLENKFHIFDNVYSNYIYSYASLVSTFQMEHHYYLFDRNLLNENLNSKKIFSGEKHSSVLINFENNGYEINYLLKDEFLFKRPYGVQFSNVKFNPWAFFTPFRFQFEDSISTENQETYLSDMLAMIKNAHTRSAPQFFFVDMGGSLLQMVGHYPTNFEHLPSKVRKKSKRVDFKNHPWKIFDDFTELYVKRVKTQNTLFMKALDQIITDDPQAIIILLGDHGSFRYRGMDKKGIENLFETMREENITNYDFANSLFNVLLAVRMPPDLILPDINTISNVNVFRYVLSSLSGTTNLIENLEENISMTNYVISVKNGIPFEYPEPINF